MKGWVGYILLAISLVIAYQGFGNSRAEPDTELAARAVACDVDSGCVLKGERPRVVRTDITRRQYEWGSTVGSIVVTCKRQYVFFGFWSCAAEKGTLQR